MTFGVVLVARYRNERSRMIHQYKNNGYNIVLDVNSGSVHVVDDVVYDVLAMMD